MGVNGDGGYTSINGKPFLASCFQELGKRINGYDDEKQEQRVGTGILADPNMPGGDGQQKGCGQTSAAIENQRTQMAQADDRE